MCPFLFFVSKSGLGETRGSECLALHLSLERGLNAGFQVSSPKCPWLSVSGCVGDTEEERVK